MMKAILGSALGGVVAGVVALVASAQGRAPEPVWGPQPSSSPYTMTVANAPQANAPASAPVQCEPHQEAALQRSFVGDREVAQVTCVPRGAAPAYATSVAPNYYAQPPMCQQRRSQISCSVPSCARRRNRVFSVWSSSVRK